MDFDVTIGRIVPFRAHHAAAQDTREPTSSFADDALDMLRELEDGAVSSRRAREITKQLGAMATRFRRGKVASEADALASIHWLLSFMIWRSHRRARAPMSRSYIDDVLTEIGRYLSDRATKRGNAPS